MARQGASKETKPRGYQDKDEGLNNSITTTGKVYLLLTAAAREAPDVCPMPASKMGCLMVRSCVSGVVRDMVSS